MLFHKVLLFGCICFTAPVCMHHLFFSCLFRISLFVQNLSRKYARGGLRVSLANRRFLFWFPLERNKSGKLVYNHITSQERPEGIFWTDLRSLLNTPFWARWCLTQSAFASAAQGVPVPVCMRSGGQGNVCVLCF